MQPPEFAEIREYPAPANLVKWPPEDMVRHFERCSLCRQWVFDSVLEEHVKRHRSFEAVGRMRSRWTVADIEWCRKAGIALNLEVHSE